MIHKTKLQEGPLKRKLGFRGLGVRGLGVRGLGFRGLGAIQG